MVLVLIGRQTFDAKMVPIVLKFFGLKTLFSTEHRYAMIYSNNMHYFLAVVLIVAEGCVSPSPPKFI